MDKTTQYYHFKMGALWKVKIRVDTKSENVATKTTDAKRWVSLEKFLQTTARQVLGQRRRKQRK